jgi:carbamoyl-phosphate synthase large subunit
VNLFFPNVGRRCELVACFAKALVRVSPGLVWGSDPNPLAPALATVDRIVALPSDFDTPQFLDELVAFLVREHIDLVIPTIDPDLVRLDQWRGVLAQRAHGALLLLSPSSTIALARDKRRSREAFARLGAEVPRAVDPFAEPLEFPLFIKPAGGSASVGARVLSSPAELAEALANTSDPMVEQVVGGEETTVDVLLDLDGRALCAVPRLRLQVRGGEVTRGVVRRDRKLEALAMRMAEGTGCSGPVTLQFREPDPGRWVAMELNARMGGGLPLSIAAGADWPQWILELAAGRRPDCSVPLVDGLQMSRHDASIFVAPDNARPPAWSGRLPLRELLVFDLDDTLYPEADFVLSGYRAVAERVWRDHGIDIEPELRRRFALGQRGDLFTPSLRMLGVQVEEAYVRDELVKTYREHTPSIRPYAEAADVLRELGAKGHSLALLSDGWASVQRRKFSALSLPDVFSAVVFTDELGSDAWKPSPRAFEHLLGITGHCGVDAAYVADNPAKDFIAPHQLSMDSFRVIRPGTEHNAVLARPRNHDARWRLHSLAQLLTKESDTGTDK